MATHAESALPHAVQKQSWTMDRVKHEAFAAWARFSRSYRRLLAFCLEQVAYLGIDLDLQMDALRDDFVTSKTFRIYVEQVFDECDVDGTGKLDGGEFYAAVLLLYHHLNRIPFSRKKFPPERAVVMRLFHEYYEQQEKVLQMINQKLLVLAELDPKDKRKSLRRNMKDSRLKKIAPRIVRESAFSLLFFVLYLVVYNGWICRNCEPVSGYLQAAAGAVALGIGLFVFNGTEIMIDELPGDLFARQVRVGEEGEEEKGKRKSRKVKVEPEVSKVTFLAMCQDHFTDVLASETWRILSVAVFLPLMAYQLKKFLFGFSLVSNLFHSQRLFPEEAVIPTFVSLVLLIFPFIDSYVEKNVLWHDFAKEKHRGYFKKYHKQLLDPERWKLTEAAVDQGRDSLPRKKRKENTNTKRNQRRQRLRKSIRELTHLPEMEIQVQYDSDIETVHVEEDDMHFASDGEVEHGDNGGKTTARKQPRRGSIMSDKQEPEAEKENAFSQLQDNVRKKSYMSDEALEVLSDGGKSAGKENGVTVGTSVTTQPKPKPKQKQKRTSKSRRSSKTKATGVAETQTFPKPQINDTPKLDLERKEGEVEEKVEEEEAGVQAPPAKVGEEVEGSGEQAKKEL